MACQNLKNLLEVEGRILYRNVEGHAWLNHIPDKRDAEQDFVNRFGWIMRELYCEMCKDNKTCESYVEYLARRC